VRLNGKEERRLLS
jgi:hypothetical protein